MKIQSTTRVVGYLRESHELNIPHCGLKCEAVYATDDIPFDYTVRFWNKHAPVRITAEIVSIRIAEDAPMIWTDGQGRILRNEDGTLMCTRTLTIMCPVVKWENGKAIYYRGHDPQTTAQRIINDYLVPTKWGNPFPKKESSV